MHMIRPAALLATASVLAAAVAAALPAAVATAHDGPHAAPAAKPESPTPVVTGWGDAAYRTVPGWMKPREGAHPGPTHGSIGQLKNGHFLIALDAGPFGIVEHDADGKFIRGFAADCVGIHHLLVREEDGVEYVYAAHLKGNRMVKLDLEGKIVLQVPGIRAITGVAVAPDGDIFVAAGYGDNLIRRFDAKGQPKGQFGGGGGEPGKFKTCHTLAVDPRGEQPTLLVCDRENRRLQRLDLDGKPLGIVATGLRRPCAVSFHGKRMAVAELEGRVIVFDGDQPVSVLGDNPNNGQWAQYGVNPKDFTEGLFTAPHGLAFDRQGNLLVMDWNASGRVTFLAPVDVKDAPPVPCDRFHGKAEFGTLVSAGAKATFSSTSQWDTPADHAQFTSAALPPFIAGQAFHTVEQDQPWALVDLGKTCTIKAFSLFNRASTPNRAAGIIVEASMDGQTWTPLWQDKEPADKTPLMWECALEKPAQARYVRARLPGKNFLHLKQIRVYGNAE